DPRRLFEGNALLRRLVRIGVFVEDRMKPDYVLGLRTEDYLERRLQSQVFKLGLAKSIHHARVLIRQKDIRFTTQLSSYQISLCMSHKKHRTGSGRNVFREGCPSPFGGGRPGRVKRRNAKRGGGDDAGSDADE
ncbi:hypothetical protein PRIPAC_78028, partial [Pristionchus pacificus]|uniref:Uncharacterized protein n=1 Tax=Pristionchus pacificus TaxID=54126 RepID=A0A2A6CP99_PRIPA